MVRRGGLLALPALAPGAAVTAAAAAPPPAPQAANPYPPIGVRPFVNARGTYTILSGSTQLPESRAAMDGAARHYVHLDELAEAVGRRLAELTKAEWGMVTNGCSAALTHATAACVTGGNPDLHVRVPDLRGFPRDECVIPAHSRNVYDAAVRAVGLRVVEVATAEELEAAFGPRTALAYILAGPDADKGPLSTKAICEQANRRGVPVLVDAAAEILTIPNVHLQLGAALVTYSGGKCLRGPQAAGLLLGRKDLVKAAWVGSAPHHGFARGFKVGKEEAMAMLAAVEAWTRRDYEAEVRTWASWLDVIARRIAPLAVRTQVTPVEGLSNRMPLLQVRWDRAKLGTSGEAVAKLLFESEPRISLFPAREKLQPGETGLTIGPYMMLPGDEKTVAERLFAVLQQPPRAFEKAKAAPAADLTGTWDVRIQYAASVSTHQLHLRQRGHDLDGTHQGDFLSRDLSGSVDGDTLTIHSAYSHGDELNYTFTGTLAGEAMGGELDLGEYLKARWSAVRHVPRKAQA
ncbi:MAG TPA: aminotransferase class V-fold PLP-dependent enzyme, partial [Vicinamibacteria bacterium]|nr:aminotransferase class V-fold PLP-dependent enzyme [Vicinamibacteria bacterium]